MLKFIKYWFNIIYTNLFFSFLKYFRKQKKETENQRVVLGHLVDILQESDLKTCDGCKKYKKHKYQLPSYSNLSSCSLESIEIENAGGKSNISEMYSIDLFLKRHGGKEFIFEKQVKYWIDYKMVDFICTIKDERVGVSVTRAMGYPILEEFGEENAKILLNKKINGLVIARNSVIESQNFSRCILHIWCLNNKIAELIQDCYKDMDNLQTDSGLLLLLTVCNDERIYKNYLHKPLT